MNYRSLAIAALFAFAAVAPAKAGEPRAVIELFTSQGCSSCPPADRLLAKLAHDPRLITLSLPVDYWDYLGWRDTLALHGNSMRQREYAIVRGDHEVYTPQAVINGMVHALGSDKAAIDRSIAETDRDDAPLTLPVKLMIADGKATVVVPAAETDHGGAEVWLLPVTDKAEVKVGRGENRGHTLTYTNVVRRWIKLGQWSGNTETFTVPLSEIPDAKFSLQDIGHLAVIVQRGSATKPGLMLGAVTADLH